MLPKALRESLFEKTSVKTMRYVKAIPAKATTGIVKRIYDMIAEDFFINGSLTSHSQVPELLAGAWIGGREVVLVTDQLDRTTKEAMGATLSYINDCPYCADMLVSLVHGGGKHSAASRILRQDEEAVSDPILRGRLAWVRQVATEGPESVTDMPFTQEELPEAIGTMFVLNYVNRFSHVAMDGSPVNNTLKNAALRLFGYELRETTERHIEPGRGLDLLPDTSLPADLAWAESNPRVASTLARWAAAVDREAASVISPKVRDTVTRSMQGWNGERMPLSRSWVDEETEHLSDEDRAIAKLVLVVAKASYQVGDSLVQAVLAEHPDEKRLIRVLAYASITASRRLAARAAEHLPVPTHPSTTASATEEKGVAALS